MIAQYPWISLKEQQRKFIEIGIIVTMMVVTLTFYLVPTFEKESATVSAPPIPQLKAIYIPPAIQKPERAIPKTPPIPIPAEEDPGMDVEFLWEDPSGLISLEALAPPAPPDLPMVDFWRVEIKPEPVGGYSAIMQSVIYPEIAREAGVEGTVIIEAVIGRDGRIESAFVVKGVPNTGLDEAALAAVLVSKWHPAFQRDKAVVVKMAIPIVFTLKQN